MAKQKLKSPFIYVGGKSRVAKVIWGALGDVDNFVEPFMGSAAVLLARPTTGKIETVNDVNCFIANFWRATKYAPEKVVEHADWPVSEVDLHSRHLWMMIGETAQEFRRKMREDPDYYDPKMAGWWVWGQNMWIGTGWCDEPGVRNDGTPEERRPLLGNPNNYGTNTAPGEKRPLLSLGNSQHGRGTHAMTQKVPDLTGHCAASGRGILAHSGNRPQLADAFSRGRGVHGNDAAGDCQQRRAWLLDWFGRLQDRLRTVRVCCGHWTRVCSSPSVTTRLGLTGIMLDPPYALDTERMHAWVRHLRGQGPMPEPAGKATNRDGNLYGSDKGDVDEMVARVHLYCETMGRKPDVRIVLAGYDSEHNDLEREGWEAVAWKGSGYGNRTSQGMTNASKERLWMSPYCLGREVEQRPMFTIWDKEFATA